MPEERTRSRRGGGDSLPAPAFSLSDGHTTASRLDAATGPMRGEMRETTTPDGIRVITESIPGVRSTSVGIWVRQGSAHEPEELTGASHLLEHMVFKGTTTRGPRDIALALERLGGSLDAFTSREHTSYQARVLSEHLPAAMDVLSDLVMNPLLKEDDLALEREVVLEEIATVEDIPDDLVFELHSRELWGVHPYGRSILGTRESVAGMRAEILRDLHRKRYLEGELIVAGAGHLRHEDLLGMVRERLEGVGGGRMAPIPDPPPPAAEGREVRVPRALGQAHLVVGTRTPPRADPARFPLVLLAAAFGGGMSSRLFQRIREELALAYTVYSFQAFHSKAGVSGVYLGTRPGSADLALEAVLEEHHKLARDGLGERELREVKDQVKGQVMLSLEATSSRLFRLAGFALYDQPYLTLDELLETIERVTPDQVAEEAARYFDPAVHTVLRLGPEDGGAAHRGGKGEEAGAGGAG
jgi:predicted Zn-dependent peptidase